VSNQLWQIGHRKNIDLARPCVVAILNITPDSFSDGGKFNSPVAAADHAERCVQDGAAALDIGGESTRPGADRIDPQEQIQRVVPVLEEIRRRLPAIAISVDTTSSLVARSAIDAGADIINDVSAGEEDDAILQLAAETGSGLILMHRLAPPSGDSYSDQYNTPPAYTDVVAEVHTYLGARLQAAIDAGVSRNSLVLDPGLGFGKSVEQNLQLIQRTAELCDLGVPVMSAASRKSFVGRIGHERDSDPADRLAGSVAISVLHAQAGARLFRVHDPAEHVHALRILEALNG
jgi:dihydropteroate synthase